MGAGYLVPDRFCLLLHSCLFGLELVVGSFPLPVSGLTLLLGHVLPIFFGGSALPFLQLLLSVYFLLHLASLSDVFFLLVGLPIL